MDYPYEDWKLRCIDEEVALLDLKTKRLLLQFEIAPLAIKLVNNNIPELQHLVDKEFHPGYLF